MSCFKIGNIAGLGINRLLVDATYFIDSQYGNDSTAVPRDMAHPYQTIDAVLALIQPGEVVYVQPGTYSAPSLALNFSTWYFSQGSTITTNVSGNGFIYGYGNFIGQSPAITCGLGDLVFYGQSVSTPSGEAIRINGSFRSIINIRYLTAETGIYIRGPCFTEINVDKFESEGIFIRTNGSSSGWIYGRYQNIETGRLIRSDSGSISMNLDFQNVISYASYMIDIEDDVGNVPNTSLYNIRIGKLNCVGLLNSSGLGGVPDMHQQPNINLDIQYINSRITDVNPIIMCSTSQVRLNYDTFAFSCFQPVPFIIGVYEGAVLHINGGKTYNYNTLNTDVGFVQVNPIGYASFKGTFTELALTSQLLECNGGGDAQIDIVNFGNICLLPRSISCVVNNSKCSVNIQKMFSSHPGESVAVVNNGDMQFNIGEWQATSTDTIMINNSSRLRTKIGYFASFGQNNNMIYTNGPIMNLEASELRMNGNNNICLALAGPTYMDIGKIVSENDGCIGIRVQDSGQLFGHVSQISLIDNTCIEYTSQGESNFTFDSLVNQASLYSIYMAGNNGKLTMKGCSMSTNNTRYPIYVVSQDAKFSLELSNLDINTCTFGIYSQAVGSDVRVNIQNFNIASDVTGAGVYSDKGTLYLEGNYFMQTGTPSPFILLSGEVIFKACLGFVDVPYRIMNSTTSGDIWYKSEESVTRELEYNISIDLPEPSQKLTLKGLFRTPGDYNIVIGNCAPTFIRILDSVMISAVKNILSPVINIISNFSIGNTGLAGGIAVPPAGFVPDAAIS